MKAWEPLLILMADRGSYSFVQKARNPQHAGAAGIIIADNPAPVMRTRRGISSVMAMVMSLLVDVAMSSGVVVVVLSLW